MKRGHVLSHYSTQTHTNTHRNTHTHTHTETHGTHVGLEAAVHAGEERVLVGDGEDALLSNGALHIIILNKHVLLQQLHKSTASSRGKWVEAHRQPEPSWQTAPKWPITDNTSRKHVEHKGEEKRREEKRGEERRGEREREREPNSCPKRSARTLTA